MKINHELIELKQTLAGNESNYAPSVAAVNNGMKQIWTKGVEYKTGRIINGKPEWCYPMSIGYLTAGVEVVIPHNLNVDSFTRQPDGFYKNEGSGTIFTIPRSYPSDQAKFGIDVVVSKTAVVLSCGTLYNGKTFIGVVNIYYLKSTN